MATAHSMSTPHGAANDLGGKLGAVGWGLFLLWIGVAILAAVPSWITLLGVGAIILAVQGARKRAGLPTEGFWVVVGFLFALGGLWDLSGSALRLLPILLIVLGGGVLISALRPGEEAK